MTQEQRSGGATVLDCRSPEAIGAGHGPGGVSVGLGACFPTWAGTALPEGTAVVLVVDRSADVWEATWHLLRIGYDPPGGWLAGGIAAWRVQGEAIGRLHQIDVGEASLEAGEVDLLDVRQPAEWASGHVDGARFVPGAELPERVGDIPDGRPLAFVCGSGYRSSVAASLLAPGRRAPVLNVAGGIGAWRARRLPVEPTPERVRPADERRSARHSGRQAERSWSRRWSSALSRLTSSSSSRRCASPPASVGTAATGSTVPPAAT